MLANFHSGGCFFGGSFFPWSMLAKRIKLGELWKNCEKKVPIKGLVFPMIVELLSVGMS